MVRSLLSRLTKVLRRVADGLDRLFKKTSSVAIYVRHSQDDTNGLKLQRQLRSCTRYADSFGANIVRVHVDVMGKKRVPLDQLLAAAKRGEFDILVIESIERLTRDPAQFVGLLASGLQIHTVRDDGPAKIFGPSWTRTEPPAICEHCVFAGSTEYPQVMK